MTGRRGGVGPERSSGVRYKTAEPVTGSRRSTVPAVPAPPPLPYSKSQINRSGSYLRWLLYNQEDASHKYELDGDRIDAAIAVVSAFRAAHSYPLTKVTVGVRQFVQTEGAVVIVAQRLKRLPQILHKLERMPKTELARMEDVGGCRAVLGDFDEISRVHRRIRKNRWDLKRERDYIGKPKDTGYRGVHLVVERDGRRIEIQLRTGGQQQWAEAVERTASRLNMPLKDGEGDDRVLEYFRLAGEGIYRTEAGLDTDEAFLAEFEAARTAVVDAGYFQRVKREGGSS